MMSKMSYNHMPLSCQLDGKQWFQLLDQKAQLHPDTEAVIFYDMNLKRSSLTYAEYQERSMQLASSLLKSGLAYGHRVLLIGTSSPNVLIFMMALHRVGARTIIVGAGDLSPTVLNVLITKNVDCRLIAYDPCMADSQMKQLMTGVKELVQHNADCGREPQILVPLYQSSSENLLKAQENLTTKTPSKPVFCSYDELLTADQPHGNQDQPKEFKDVLEAQLKVQPDDESFAYFTSGSTGEPKLVQQTTHSLMNFRTGRTLNERGPRATLFLDRPICWLAGFLHCHMAIVENVTLVVVPTEMTINESSIENVFRIWEEEKCSMSQLTTATINKLVQDSMHLKYDLRHMKMFHIGGQTYSLSLIQNLLQTLPEAKIWLMYGATECCLISDQVVSKEDAIEGVYGRMSPIPGGEIKIIDDDNKIVPRGTRGEICVRNLCVFQEYVGNPKETQKSKSKAGWVHTGDIGCMDDQGRIEILGRRTAMIKRLWNKILPIEIEDVIHQHPFVVDVVVVGIPDQQLHEEICACVILQQNQNDEKAQLHELQMWCQEQWPPNADGLSMSPKYFLPMKRFPVTSSGKTFVRGVKSEALKRLGITENN